MADDQAFQITYLDGDEGTYSYVLRAGKARVTYSNGDTFEGTFNNERQKEGQGKYTYAAKPVEGSDEEPVPHVYEGDFVANKRTGVGKLTYPDGSEYTGSFIAGNRHGDGVMKFKNGDIFSGSFKHNLMHGNGVYQFNESGATLEGEWERGEVVFGRFTHSDGNYFEGYFVDNVFSGEGVHVMPRSGMVQEGEFVGKIVPVDDAKDRSKNIWVGTNTKTLETFTQPTSKRVSYVNIIGSAEGTIIQLFKAFNYGREEKVIAGDIYIPDIEELVEVTQKIGKVHHLDAFCPDATAQLIEDLRLVHRKRDETMDVDEYLDWFKTTLFGVANSTRRYEDLDA